MLLLAFFGGQGVMSGTVGRRWSLRSERGARIKYTHAAETIPVRQEEGRLRARVKSTRSFRVAPTESVSGSFPFFAAIPHRGLAASGMPASGAQKALLVLEPLTGPGRRCPYHGTQCRVFRTNRRAQRVMQRYTSPTHDAGLWAKKGWCCFRSLTDHAPFPFALSPSQLHTGQALTPLRTTPLLLVLPLEHRRRKT